MTPAPRLPRQTASIPRKSEKCAAHPENHIDDSKACRLRQRKARATRSAAGEAIRCRSEFERRSPASALAIAREAGPADPCGPARAVPAGEVGRCGLQNLKES